MHRKQVVDKLADLDENSKPVFVHASDAYRHIEQSLLHVFIEDIV